MLSQERKGYNMKKNRNIINLPILLLSGFFFAGCYTQMESVGNEGSDRRNGDRDDYTYNDSTNDQDSGATTADNYFNDDGYRSMRYRMSFDYYYPSRHMWAAGVWFDPWYDGFYADPWDPWYRPGLWYPTIAYPYPYWSRGWGYYPHYGSAYGYGHWRGNNFPMYGTTIEPGRRRTTGNTRGDDAGLRIRGGAVSPVTNPAAGSTSPGGLRTRDVPGSVTHAATEADRSTRRRTREEVPWWERSRSSSQDSPDRIKTTDRSRVANDNASTVTRQRVNQKTSTQSTQRDRRQQSPQARTTERARQKPGSSPSSRSRQENPRYSSPPRESGRSRGGSTGATSTGTTRGGGERGRREK